MFIVPLFIKVENANIQKEIDELNVFKADFSNWQIEMSLERNISCIIFLTMLSLSIIFLVFGLLSYFKKSKNK